MRTVIEIPVYHATAELFSNPNSLECLLFRSHPLVQQLDDIVENYFDEIRRFIREQTIHVDKIYQDSYAHPSQLKRFKALDTPNLRLVRELEADGAQLLRSESALLLLAYVGTKYLQEYVPRVESTLLTWRDRYIASNIASSLVEKETGVLFIGVAHDVSQELSEKAADINIIKPDFSDHYLGLWDQAFIGMQKEVTLLRGRRPS